MNGKRARCIFWVGDSPEIIEHKKNQCLSLLTSTIESNKKYAIEIKEAPTFDTSEINFFCYVPNLYQEQRAGNFHEYQLSVTEIPRLDYTFVEEKYSGIIAPASFKDRVKKAWNILNKKL